MVIIITLFRNNFNIQLHQLEANLLFYNIIVRNNLKSKFMRQNLTAFIMTLIK